jgi:hypothetical protein
MPGTAAGCRLDVSFSLALGQKSLSDPDQLDEQAKRTAPIPGGLWGVGVDIGAALRWNARVRFSTDILIHN